MSLNVHRLGIIGAGDVVRRAYLPALRARTDCEVAAICSASGASARDVAATWGIPRVYDSADALLADAAIDAVIVATPPDSHRDLAERAMTRRKHVLVEKPLCPRYADSRSLLEAASRYDRTFYVAFNNQFREENAWLRTQVQSGVGGDAELVDFAWFRTRRHESKRWLYDPARTGGGVLMDLGVHLIHLALGMIADRTGFEATCVIRSHTPGAVEDTAVAMITLDGGPVLLISTGWDMNLPSPSRVVLEVHGTGAFLSNKDFEGARTDGFTHLVDDFVRHVDGGTRPDLGLVDDTMCLTDALYRAAESGGPVKGRFGEMRA